MKFCDDKVWNAKSWGLEDPFPFESPSWGTPWPYLTFIVGTLVQSSQCNRHQILVFGAVWLHPNSPECRCNVRLSPTCMRQGLTANYTTVPRQQCLFLETFYAVFISLYKVPRLFFGCFKKIQVLWVFYWKEEGFSVFQRRHVAKWGMKTMGEMMLVLQDNVKTQVLTWDAPSVCLEKTKMSEENFCSRLTINFLTFSWATKDYLYAFQDIGTS